MKTSNPFSQTAKLVGKYRGNKTEITPPVLRPPQVLQNEVPETQAPQRKAGADPSKTMRKMAKKLIMGM